MALIQLATLPVRLTVAAAQVTLSLAELVDPQGPVRRPGGYGERLMDVIGEGGYIERVARALTDPNGPMAVVNVVAAATAPDRPLGRALAEGGTLDRLLERDGPVHRMLEEEGALDRLFAEGGPLDRLTREGGVLERLLREEGLLDRLLEDDGFLEKLTAEGGTLDQLVALGYTLETIQPRLAELSMVIPELHRSVDALNQAVEPLSGLAVRFPGTRRRSAIES